ncbi:MAG: sigma-54 dependent transcriptional regulator [Gammaproteobacteria bacterium]|nr:sigma-54 dependent transcriptional regulator [Gammaproteobacteria bacterium]
MTEPAVLIVEDDAHLREALFDTLANESLPVLTADNGVSALEVLDRQHVGLVISDLQMQPMDGATLLREIRVQHPALPAVLMTAHGSIENAVDAMQNGAADYLVKPFEADQLVRLVSKYLRTAVAGDEPIAADPKTLELMRIAQRVAATEATVTISGESGCGKEVFARYIHTNSPRKERPFVAINCAAIPENMLEAVLFGYEKGAFTGASAAHAGKFEQAQHGSLLLDEISEMDLALQAKLLRVLQEKEIERIGGRKTLPLDVRVLATTNRDLRRHVADGRFREDLFYRLNVFPLHVPALRERPDDILPLAEFIIRRHEGDASVITLTENAKQMLCAHSWPGNVRELENLLQRSLILLSGNRLRATDLSFDDASFASADANQVPDCSQLQTGLKNREFQLIVDALSSHSGNRSAVAAALGISTRTLRYKLARMRAEGVAIPGEKIAASDHIEQGDSA